MEEAAMLRCCEDLLLQSLSSPSSQWQQAVDQVQAAIKVMGSSRASPLLLSFLRRPDLPDCVLDVLSHAIAFCCGSCSSPPSALTFTFSPSLCVRVKEMDYVTGGLGWKVWGTALILSWKLVDQQKDIKAKKVLELGSGCGLCGLLTAKLGACEVVLTDYMPEVLANLCENTLNLPASVLGPVDLDPLEAQSQYPELSYDYVYGREDTDLTSKCSPAIVRVRMLDWAEDALLADSMDNKELRYPLLPRLSSDETFDWVIGSDLVYDHYNIKSLAAVITHRLSKQGGKAIFGIPVRENQEVRLFLSELDAYGMDVHVEQCSQQEWDACMDMLEIEEGGTFHGVDHYEGGLLIMHVKHKP
ncbi:hypothetical protein KP509_35G006400 [Ceratopteris richardii]|uniref:Uncharacterized protein n=2 Tax=Ceratopteris richardii TaxID=49495 RepID=A0A8T2QEW6_CERRI|nr:hypothetical protein KP509_35G006400 [Ceratopteris richardii]